MKISEFFARKPVISFEVFPPKPTTPESAINETIDALTKLRPNFISVTYGAGGGTNFSRTAEITSKIKNEYGIESISHLPCLYMTKADVRNTLDGLKQIGVDNVLALRGDVSPSAPPCDDFKYADELIAFIKETDDFCVIAACYPEGHPESENLVEDIKYLKRKVDAGTDGLVTQFFLDNEYFYSFRERTEIAGITVPIQAGVMPVTNKSQIERMVALCGIELPRKFTKMISKYESNPTALRDAGIAYATEQIVDLIAQDIDGIHLYTMNNPYIAEKIYAAIQSLL